MEHSNHCICPLCQQKTAPNEIIQHVLECEKTKLHLGFKIRFEQLENYAKEITEILNTTFDSLYPAKEVNFYQLKRNHLFLLEEEVLLKEQEFNVLKNLMEVNPQDELAEGLDALEKKLNEIKSAIRTTSNNITEICSNYESFLHKNMERVNSQIETFFEQCKNHLSLQLKGSGQGRKEASESQENRKILLKIEKFRFSQFQGKLLQEYKTALDLLLRYRQNVQKYQKFPLLEERWKEHIKLMSKKAIQTILAIEGDHSENSFEKLRDIFERLKSDQLRKIDTLENYLRVLNSHMIPSLLIVWDLATCSRNFFELKNLQTNCGKLYLTCVVNQNTLEQVFFSETQTSSADLELSHFQEVYGKDQNAFQGFVHIQKRFHDLSNIWKTFENQFNSAFSTLRVYYSNYAHDDLCEQVTKAEEILAKELLFDVFESERFLSATLKRAIFEVPLPEDIGSKDQTKFFQNFARDITASLSLTRIHSANLDFWPNRVEAFDHFQQSVNSNTLNSSLKEIQNHILRVDAIHGGLEELPNFIKLRSQLVTAYQHPLFQTFLGNNTEGDLSHSQNNNSNNTEKRILRPSTRLRVRSGNDFKYGPIKKKDPEAILKKKEDKLNKKREAETKKKESEAMKNREAHPVTKKKEDATTKKNETDFAPKKKEAESTKQKSDPTPKRKEADPIKHEPDSSKKTEQASKKKETNTLKKKAKLESEKPESLSPHQQSPSASPHQAKTHTMEVEEIGPVSSDFSVTGKVTPQHRICTQCRYHKLPCSPFRPCKRCIDTDRASLCRDAKSRFVLNPSTNLSPRDDSNNNSSNSDENNRNENNQNENNHTENNQNENNQNENNHNENNQNQNYQNENNNSNNNSNNSNNNSNNNPKDNRHGVKNTGVEDVTHENEKNEDNSKGQQTIDLPSDSLHLLTLENRRQTRNSDESVGVKTRRSSKAKAQDQGQQKMIFSEIVLPMVESNNNSNGTNNNSTHTKISGPSSNLDTFCTIRATQSFDSGKTSSKILLQKVTSPFWFGIATDSFPWDKIACGFDKHSWSVSSTGDKVHRGKEEPLFDRKFRDGDSLDLVVDIDKGVLQFSFNDNPFVEAFVNLPKGESFRVAVSRSGGDDSVVILQHAHN